MECYSAIKRNKVLIYAVAYMNHDNIMLSERIQSTMPYTYILFHLCKMSRIGRNTEDRK